MGKAPLEEGCNRAKTDIRDTIECEACRNGKGAKETGFGEVAHGEGSVKVGTVPTKAIMA